MSMYSGVNTALAAEEREQLLPQWAQEKILAGRKANEEADYWRRKVDEGLDRVADLERQLAEGFTQPDSDTWVTVPGVAAGAEASADIGLGTGVHVHFGGSVDSSTATAWFADDGLYVRMAGPPVIRTGSWLPGGADLHIELG